MTKAGFNVGYVVTRDGTDEHLVFEGCEYHDAAENIGVVCIKAPAAPDGEQPWTRIGETERNLARRYTSVRRARYEEPNT